MSEKRAMPVAIYHACEECGDEFELLVPLDSGTKLYTHPAPVEALETLFRHYDLNDLDERDEDDELDREADCGLRDDGQCMLAGTEWCDFECPYPASTVARLQQEIQRLKDAELRSPLPGPKPLYAKEARS